MWNMLNSCLSLPSSFSMLGFSSYGFSLHGDDCGVVSSIMSGGSSSTSVMGER